MDAGLLSVIGLGAIGLLAGIFITGLVLNKHIQ